MVSIPQIATYISYLFVIIAYTVKVVNYLRNYFLEFEIAPPVRMVIKQTGFDLKTIYSLFPGGPAKGACKVAGLPKPTGCV